MSLSCTFAKCMLLLLCFSGSLFAAVADSTDQMTESAKVAENWLKIVDDGNFGNSWNEMALRTKLTIQKGEWEQIMNAMRKPLGRSLSRRIAEQRPAPNPKGLPAGDYMMIVYSSVFSNKSSAQELVTLVLGEDRKWHVLTYLVN